jgi:peptide deformylase
MSRELTLYPDDVLNTPCEEVTDPSEWDQLREDMVDLLYEKNGIGLAAPQVGESIQLFLLRLDPDKQLHEAYFNPVIESIEQKETLTEGCLSFPNVEVQIDRGLSVTFTALTPAGDSVERTVSGIQAQCVQHEVDHLKGKTLLDRCDLSQKMKINDRLSMLEDGEIPPPIEETSIQ